MVPVPKRRTRELSLDGALLYMVFIYQHWFYQRRVKDVTESVVLSSVEVHFISIDSGFCSYNEEENEKL